MSAQNVIAGATSKMSIFEFSNPRFREDFDERSFEFKHSVTADHPLFSRERMRRLLVNPATKNNVYYNAGDIRVDQRWDAVPERTKPVEEVFDSLDNSGDRRRQKDAGGGHLHYLARPRHYVSYRPYLQLSHAGQR